MPLLIIPILGSTLTAILAVSASLLDPTTGAAIVAAVIVGLVLAVGVRRILCRVSGHRYASVWEPDANLHTACTRCGTEYRPDDHPARLTVPPIPRNGARAAS